MIQMAFLRSFQGRVQFWENFRMSQTIYSRVLLVGVTRDPFYE